MSLVMVKGRQEYGEGKRRHWEDWRQLVLYALLGDAQEGKNEEGKATIYARIILFALLKSFQDPSRNCSA